MAVWLQVKVLWPTAYRLYFCSVCDTTVPLRLQLPLVALHQRYVFTILPICLRA